MTLWHARHLDSVLSRNLLGICASAANEPPKAIELFEHDNQDAKADTTDTTH